MPVRCPHPCQEELPFFQADSVHTRTHSLCKEHRDLGPWHAPLGAWCRARPAQLYTRPCDKRTRALGTVGAGGSSDSGWLSQPPGAVFRVGEEPGGRGASLLPAQPADLSQEKCALSRCHQQHQELYPICLPVSPASVLCSLSVHASPCVPDSL